MSASSGHIDAVERISQGLEATRPPARGAGIRWSNESLAWMGNFEMWC